MFEPPASTLYENKTGHTFRVWHGVDRPHCRLALSVSPRPEHGPKVVPSDLLEVEQSRV